ncbi:hypothetical protein [Roseimicrobium sp. ORNL1]|uniref:hypothetical protein n=1 Tax=Roseimicrobium sp. ORNL1 TaxID=2711231 RepID=UPI0013E108A2|nr:hypothetical protein [Roseimicrobium sp. ORNL1]QIF03063.1 hypothetical protein G5S37_16555 [Roseimicrobium sp. ORNL1]
MSQKLSELRHALLELHKALVESERAAYEAANGRIQSPNHFLQLLTNDPWFEWLRELSQLIVVMDEAEDDEELLTDSNVDAMVAAVRKLLTASGSGEGFNKRYILALQGNPEVVLAHAKALEFL